MKKTRSKSQRSKSKKSYVVSGGRAVEARASGELNRVNEHAAGIDVGGERHYVAVPPGSAENPVREFGVFTKDLYAIADWLRECGVETVAMESTGVYWVPLFEVLEERGFKVKLVDARKVKNVSGRKSDVLDCQWLQQLESYGLLQAAYRPADEIVVLRSYVRQRGMLVKSAAIHIQHMQKALQQMNLRLDAVVSDITGQTGMRIIKGVLAGERDARKLGGMRDFRCYASEEEIAQSLVGNYRQEHLFSLKQAVELFEYYQEKIAECERARERTKNESENEWSRISRNEPGALDSSLSQKRHSPRVNRQGERNSETTVEKRVRRVPGRPVLKRLFLKSARIGFTSFCHSTSRAR